MAIDELLAQSDRSRRPTRVRPGPAANSAVSDPLVRAAANRASIPTGMSGIGDALPPRSFGDAAARTAAAAPAAAQASGTARTAKAFGSRAIRLGATPLSAVKSVASGAARAVGAGMVALPAATSSIESFNTPTEGFRDRLGMDPAGGGVAGDAAARTLGTFQNAGNAISGGIAGQLGEALGGYLADARDRAVTPAYAVGRPATKAATPATGAAQMAAERPNSTATPGNRPKLYRNGNSFSDQPIAGGTEYQPKRGTVTATPATSAGAGTSSDVQAARDREGSLRNTAAVNQMVAKGELKELARNARIDAGSLLHTRGFQPRGSAAARQQKAADLELAAVQIGAGVPEKDFLTTAAQESEIDQNAKQAKLAEQQGIAAGIANQQALAQQQITQKILGIDQLPPDEQRQVSRQALLLQGKDPAADRYIKLKQQVPTGYDDKGNPVMYGEAEGLYDPQAGRMLNLASGAAGGAGQAAANQFDKGKLYTDAQGRTARWDGSKFVPVN